MTEHAGEPLKPDFNENLVFQNVFFQSELGLIIVDSNCCIVNWNPWFSRSCGIESSQIIGRKLFEIFFQLKQSSLERSIKSAIHNGMSSFISHSLNRKPFPLYSSSGEQIHQQIVVKPLQKTDGSRFCLIQINDVSSGVKREKQLIKQLDTNKAVSLKLAEEKERAQVTLNSIADAVITTNEEGLILSMNLVAEVLTGVFEEKAIQKDVTDIFTLVHEDSEDRVACPVKHCLKLKDIVANDRDHILINKQGLKFSINDSVAPIIDDDDNLLGSVLVFRDVTESRSLSAELNWQALHDPLTNLANRRQFEINMKDLLIKARMEKVKHHLLYLDLDQFKVVNDTCGHDAGDELLKQVTDILEKNIRKNDLLARLGGDEFAVLLENCDAEHAIAVANNLRQTIADFRFGWQTQSFKVGLSIGIAEISGEEIKASEILSAADAACYIAKESGRNRVHFHELNSSASSARQQEMQWVSKLQAALDHGRFSLYLQRIKQVNFRETDSEHYEVLLRMLDDQNKIIPPGAFLPAAERFNLISSIDQWVFNEVFNKLEELKRQNKFKKNLVLSINLSGATMANDELLCSMIEHIENSEFPANMFCFEITETAAIANLKQATGFLSELRSKGCKIALDDFGSGLSSFAYLKNLPIDYLKIDGYFVKDIAIDDLDKAFVAAINQIGQVMGLETIAEFVEDEAILGILSEIGVNYAQGYGVHVPKSFEEIFYS